MGFENLEKTAVGLPLTWPANLVLTAMPAAASSSSAGRAYRPVQRDTGLRLTRCQCRAGRHARPVDEQHQAFSVTLVERGVFTYRSPSGQAVLSPGWLMLAND